MTDRQALGIDINQYARTGGVNYSLAREHIQAGVYDFVIIKVGLGLYKVGIFDEQVNGCVQHDIPYTTYHFPDPDVDMKAQARKYVDWVGAKQQSYIVDVEKPRSNSRPPNRSELLSYLGELEGLIQKKPILYSSISVLSSINFINDAKGYKLWIAHYLYMKSLWPAQKKKYRYFHDFVTDHDWEIPPAAKGTGLENNVILWQFTDIGDGRRYIYNEHTNDPTYPIGMTNADLNISIQKRDDFMASVFSAGLKDITAQYIEALDSHDPNRVVGLYADQAVHSTPERTIHGKEKIKAWYQTLFTQLLPNGSFQRTGFTASGNSRTCSWTARSDAGQVLDGNDTFGLMNDKIVYHYTHFNVTQ
ncbi:MAG: hypothetical protein FJ010_08135 [Chloroflexi bacterium]|nr:hypothetical protein [Chloroflexota bacterium]